MKNEAKEFQPDLHPSEANSAFAQDSHLTSAFFNRGFKEGQEMPFTNRKRVAGYLFGILLFGLGVPVFAGKPISHSRPPFIPYPAHQKGVTSQHLSLRNRIYSAKFIPQGACPQKVSPCSPMMTATPGSMRFGRPPALRFSDSPRIARIPLENLTPIQWI